MRKEPETNTDETISDDIKTDASTQTPSKDDSTNVGYPDINKADTKMIVIVSFIFILLIFLLSVFVPQQPAEPNTTTTEQTSTTSTDSQQFSTSFPCWNLLYHFN